MNIDDASLEDLMMAMEKKRLEYMSYKYKYWNVFLVDENNKNISHEIVLAVSKEDAIKNVQRFKTIDNLSSNSIVAEIIDPSYFNERIAVAKSEYEKLESLKIRFKKLNDL